MFRAGIVELHEWLRSGSRLFRRPHHHIESPKLLNSLIDGSSDVRFLSDISLRGQHLDIGVPLGDQRGHLFHVLKVDVYKDDICTFLCKQDGRFQSDATEIQVRNESSSSR
jgi:hypothetical protein